MATTASENTVSRSTARDSDARSSSGTSRPSPAPWVHPRDLSPESRLSSHEITTAITAVQGDYPGFGGTSEIMKEIVGRSLDLQVCAILIAGNPEHSNSFVSGATEIDCCSGSRIGTCCDIYAT
jgi:hypothetical protein